MMLETGFLVSDEGKTGLDMWDDEDATFNVVYNDEGQYSIWHISLPNPEGWKVLGMTGTKKECLAIIDERWTDMRPTSLIDAVQD